MSVPSGSGGFAGRRVACSQGLAVARSAYLLCAVVFHQQPAGQQTVGASLDWHGLCSTGHTSLLHLTGCCYKGFDCAEIFYVTFEYLYSSDK